MNIENRRRWASIGHARVAVAGSVWRGFLTATVFLLAVAPAWSQDSVTNQARVVNPPGVECSDLIDNPDCSREDTVITPVVPPSVVAYDFCPAGGTQPIFSLTNGAFIARYLPGSGADAPEPLLDAPAVGGSNTNGLMIDPVRNRMLFISRAGSNSILWAYDAGNGGWYVAQSAFASPDFPRAGMTADGVGYLIAGGSATPQVWQVVADPSPGSFGYTASLLGTLSYDQPPTDTNSGDIAFDAAGDGWLVAGQDLYRFDPDTLVAVRQTRPTLGGAPSTINWAGVAFADNGDLYVANNNNPSRYFAYDPATGVLAEMAPTAANASRDLASCAFPAVAEPELGVVKDLATVNGEAYVAGSPVEAGDVLAYRLTFTNSGGAVGTLFPGDVTETLPEHTSVVAAGNDFTCAGSNCVNTAALNVPANGSAILNFIIQIDDPIPAGVSTITNAITVAGLDCDAPGNDCTELTPVGPAISVSKSLDVGAGTPVALGDTLTYTLTATVANAATTEPVVLTDTLADGLEFGAVIAAGTFSCNAASPLVCTLPPGQAPGSYDVVYTATVAADATTAVSNAVVTDTGTCVVCEIDNPVAPSVVIGKSSDPADGSSVAPGDELTYTVTATVSASATTADVILTDTLGAGLTFGAVVSTPAGASCAGTNPVVCTLPAGALPGSYAFVYTASVDADATGSVGNVVIAGGDDAPECPADGCETEHPVVDPTVVVTKSADPANGSTVAPGDALTYTVTATVSDSATTDDVVLTDTLGAGLSFGGIVSTPAGASCAGTNPIVCTLPSGALPGSYAFVYTASVDADATGSVGNVVVATGADAPECPAGGCETEHPVIDPTVVVTKSADPANGSVVSPGDELTYTVTATVSDSATTGDLVLTDTLGTGLSFGAVVSTPAGASCTGTNPIVCTLPAGALPGSYAFIYTASVDADATGSVGNVVLATGDDAPECPAGGCETEHPVIDPSVTVSKSVALPPERDDGMARPGDLLTYSIQVVVADSATTAGLVLTDTLSGAQTLVDVTSLPAGGDCDGGSPLLCTLAVGSLPGTYVFTYTARVDDDASGTVGNVVLPSGPDQPECPAGACQTTTPVAEPRVTYSKLAEPGSGTAVSAGDIISYVLSATIAESSLTQPLVLVDTLGAGLTLASVPEGCEAEGQNLTCTLEAGTAPGSYSFEYTASVDADASGTLGNSVAGSGGGGEPPVCGASCETGHPLVEPVLVLAKSSDPASGAEVTVGQTITYTLSVTVSGAATLSDVVLVDTPDAGLDIGAMPAGCTLAGGELTCVLPQGSVPGVYDFTYEAVVNASAGSVLDNAVTGSGGGTPGSGTAPSCEVCATRHELQDQAQLRLSKQAGSRRARVGDLVRYTLRIENVGTTNVTDAHVIDNAPVGFSYVDGSLSVVDRDNAGTISGYNPMRIGGLDIDAGDAATVVYLMRVGAGVRAGEQVNQAQVFDSADNPVSGIATASLLLDGDPLLDEALVFGTVFDDRDGDGWQDSAELSGLRLRGLEGAGEISVDRGAGPQPATLDADGSLALGVLAGRQSIADPASARRIVVRQRLQAPGLQAPVVLDSRQGISLRMDAGGEVTTHRQGEAARGLTAAAPTLERVVAVDGDGHVVDYVISNEGIDERGIPGVRIASVEGLLMETDAFGRYHLIGVHGGLPERGRNFILKVDPATLPAGTVFSTDNPLLRRVTPGLPVRFDFGVQLPVQQIEGGRREVELELGEIIFAPGSAVVRDAYLPVLERLAVRMAGYQHGEVAIEAVAENDALAMDRAVAVRTALDRALPEGLPPGVDVVVRTRVDVPEGLVAGVGRDGALLGTVLFDTDRSEIKPEFAPLLERVAAWLEAYEGGVVSVVGHTDPRAPASYNLALGMRRAQAVFDALMPALSPETRSRVRVVPVNPAPGPAGERHE